MADEVAASLLQTVLEPFCEYLLDIFTVMWIISQFASAFIAVVCVTVDAVPCFVLECRVFNWNCPKCIADVILSSSHIVSQYESLTPAG